MDHAANAHKKQRRFVPHFTLNSGFDVDNTAKKHVSRRMQIREANRIDKIQRPLMRFA